MYQFLKNQIKQFCSLDFELTRIKLNSFKITKIFILDVLSMYK